jgi:hypothetical protein
LRRELGLRCCDGYASVVCEEVSGGGS